MKKVEFKTFIARYLSLNEKEVEVYRIILKNGPITAGEIALHVEMPYEEVCAILGNLREKGLIVQLPGIVERYITTPPYKAFTEYLSELETAIEKKIAVSKGEFRRYLAKTDKTVGKIGDEIFKSLEENIETLKSRVSVIRSDIESLSNKSLGELEKNLRELNTGSSKFFENLRSEEEELLNAIREKIGTLINEGSKALISTFYEWKDQASTLLSQEEKLFEKSFANWKTESLDTLDNIMGGIGSNIDNISSEFLNTIREITSELEKTSGEISENIAVSYKNGLTLIETSTSNIQSKAMEILGESINLQKEKMSDLSDLLSKSLSDISLFFNNSVSEIRNNIENNLNTWLKEEESYLNDLLEKNKDLISSSKNIVIEYLDKASNEIISKMSSLGSTISELLKDAGVNVGNYLQRDLERVKEEFSTVRDETNQLLLENLADYEEVLKVLEKSAADVINTGIAALKEAQSTVEEKIWSKLTSTLENYQSTMQDLLNNTAESIKTIKETIEGEISKLKEEYQKEIETRVEKFIEEINVLKQEIESMVSSSLLKLKEHTDIAKKTVKETVSTALNDIRMIIETLEKKLTSTEKHFSETIDAEASRVIESINNIKTASEEKIAGYEQLLRTISSQVEQSTLAAIYNCFQEFSKGLETAGNNVAANLEANLSNLNQIFSVVKEDVSGALTSWQNSATQEAKKLEETVKRTISQIVEEYKIKNERVRSSLQKKLQQLLENRENEVKDLTGKLNSYILETESKVAKTLSAETIRSFVEEGKQTVEETVSSHMQKVEEISNQIEKIRNTTNEIIENTKRTLEVTLQKTENHTINLVRETQETVSNLMDTLTKAVDGAEEKISSVMLEHLTEFKETWITGQKNVLSQIQSSNEKLNGKLMETKKKITEILNMSSKTISNSINTLKTSISNISDSQLQKFRTYISDFRTSLEKIIEKEKNKQAEMCTNIKNEMEKTLVEIEQDRYSLFEKLEKSRSTLTSSVSALVNNFVNNVSDSVVKSLSSHINEYVSKTADLHKKIERNLAEIPGELKTLLIKLKLEELLKGLVKKTTETRDALTYIWEEIKKIKPLEVERIWYIMGRDAVFTYIRNAINRTEKSLTLVFPSLDDALMFKDDIKKLGSPKRIYIITDAKIPEDNEKIREILKLKTIRFRLRSQRDCYGIIRDGKELLIAPLPEEGEVIALVTDMPEYVKMLQNVIGEIWIRQSKSIRLRDLQKSTKKRK
nr:helix-turn-helix domain-containing protein [Candidatus Baldrarchaeota archaeon]